MQGWNLRLLHCRRVLYHLSHLGNPKYKDRGGERKGVEMPGDQAVKGLRLELILNRAMNEEGVPSGKPQACDRSGDRL